MDAANKKSYVGPPIKNNPTGISFAGVGTGTGYVCTGITEVIDIPQLGPTTAYTSNIQNDYSTSGNCCPSLFQYGGYAVTGSTLYTYGIVYRCQSGYTHPNFMYRYEYNGGTYVTESGVHDNAKRIHLGNGWYWAWNTFTTQPSTTQINSSGLWFYNYSTFSDKISVAKVFVTQGDYTGLHPKYWPAFNTTRSTTQAIVDPVGNKTITPTNLNSTSYSDSTGITLDGNNQYLYADGGSYWNAWSPNGVNGNSSLSVELVFSSNDTDGLLVSRPWNGSGQYNYTMYNSSFGLHSNAGGASLGYSSICTGQIAHMVWWMNSTQYGVYKNGQVLVAATNHGLSGGGGSAGTGDFGTLFGSLYPYGEGWGGNTGFSIAGKYYLARIYNRVLSASEVLQNFNALKQRFFGYASLTYTFSSNVTLTGNGTQDVTMFKNANNGSWNGQVYSLEKFSAPCTIEFLKNAASGDNGVSYAMIGWNSDPTTNADYNTLDHASYPYRTDSYQVYNNGTNTLNSGTWETNKRFYVVYDTDGYIRHYNGGTLLYTANYGTGITVYVDSSFYSVDATYGGFTGVKVSRQSWNGSSYV